MKTIAEGCSSAVAFPYRSIDRLILNAYLPTLQTPGAMAWLLREVCGKPILSPVVFKALTDRFVAKVLRFAHQHRIPLLRPTGSTKPGAVAQQALRRAARAQRWGVVAIVVHQESARVLASHHAGGRRTNFRVREERRLVNHYSFSLRDRIWLNAHGYLTAQLQRRGIPVLTADNCIVSVADPVTLPRIAARFDARPRAPPGGVRQRPPGLYNRQEPGAPGLPGRLVAYHALTRLQKAQAVAVATALDRSTFERLVTPSEHGGPRVAGLRFGAPRAMRLLAALGCAGLTFKAFSQAELRAVLVDRLGVPPAECTPAQLAYDLRKLRGKGVVRKVDGRHRYTLTDLGYRVAMYWTKLHQRLLTPALGRLDAVVRSALAASPHPLDRTLTRLNASFDELAEVAGFKFAA